MLFTVLFIYYSVPLCSVLIYLQYDSGTNRPGESSVRVEPTDTGRSVQRPGQMDFTTPLVTFGCGQQNGMTMSGFLVFVIVIQVVWSWPEGRGLVDWSRPLAPRPAPPRPMSHAVSLVLAFNVICRESVCPNRHISLRLAAFPDTVVRGM